MFEALNYTQSHPYSLHSNWIWSMNRLNFSQLSSLQAVGSMFEWLLKFVPMRKWL